LMGPVVTARYGGGLLWLATLSIVFQTIYNVEISRYTLYTGEPIFTGKFRTLPGPMFWVFVYIALDFGMIFPYLAASAATPLAAVLWGRMPEPGVIAGDEAGLRYLSYGIFIGSFLPLIIGGKVYNSIKALMFFKIAVVFGFLLIVAVLYSSWSTWHEISTGFVKFGTVPVQAGTDLDGNGQIDPAERKEAVKNVFASAAQGEGIPTIDFTLLASIAALVAIAGNGGLSNTPISNYTRDQGWGMGWHVGAIPSMIGGRKIKLSHVGSVFQVTAQSLQHWRRWYKHVLRDQFAVWMPACFIGLALPSMLSVEFLPRGTEANKWTAAGMTAGAIRDRVSDPNVAFGSPSTGQFFWYMTLFCGFLVLAPSMVTTVDGVVRRWVDVFWTASPRLRALETTAIKKVYFWVLACYGGFGLIMLSVSEPTELLNTAALILNYALGFSCWHTLAVNTLLLPPALRPNWFVRAMLLLGGMFFTLLSVLSTLQRFGVLEKIAA
ncbi:MAG: Nramp family divalent metal transporter, partial [Planctomycetaceae bacterium]|nr:Nramp family divalent metal transporter [Planctomycetaceae bacterium]